MTASTMDVIGLTAGYHGASVLRDVNLSVGQGEIIALLGANGAGKTTLLSVMSGLLKPMGGRVEFESGDIAGIAAYDLVRRGLVHVPEDRGIFSELTVAEHFKIGVPSDFEYVAEYFPILGELHQRRAGLLSGGEQQMLALAQALGRRPKVLLVDELSLGLAPIIVESILPVIRSFAGQDGASVILVEQHIELVLEIADRAMVLQHGDVTFAGLASDLRGNHQLLEDSYLGSRL